MAAPAKIRRVSAAPAISGAATGRAHAAAIVLAGVVTFVAVFHWAGRDATSEAQAPAGLEDAASFGDPEAGTWANADPRPDAPRADAADPATATHTADAAAERSFGGYVSRKYHFLLTDPSLDAAGRGKLLGALLARERIAVAINTARQSSDAPLQAEVATHRAALAQADARVAELLRPQDNAAFEVLRDSDIEQFQLDDYAGGVANVAPLSDADRRAILLTKLTYRARFRRVLDDSGLMRGDLTAAERAVVLSDVANALTESKNSYLQEVRQYLYDDEQYTLLRNYEETEYNAELDKLRRIAAGG